MSDNLDTIAREAAILIHGDKPSGSVEEQLWGIAVSATAEIVRAAIDKALAEREAENEH